MNAASSDFDGWDVRQLLPDGFAGIEKHQTLKLRIDVESNAGHVPVNHWFGIC
ncbi:MAG: hypothetical protein ACP5HZ_02675 [Ferrimicrobium sp.]